MAGKHDTIINFMHFKKNKSGSGLRDHKVNDFTNRSNSTEHVNNYPESQGELDSQRQNSTVNETGRGVPEISIDSVKRAAKAFARGGYAKVYEAEWQKQSVALKVLRQQSEAPIKFLNLLKEAHLATTLNHPNVVRVFGVVSIDGGKGILMEKADRGSLRSALNATNKLSLDQLVSVSIDIVDGLDFIHSKQMIHRDLKPENVLLFDIKSQLTAKIADFGISRVILSSRDGTTFVGTPYYMAPELFKPQARYGAKVDVYSVSIVLYEVFSGRNIHDSYTGIENTMQLAICVVNGQRPKIPKSFPAELRTVVERGWSGDADDRPTLADFRAALSRLKPSTSSTILMTASPSTSAGVDVHAAFEAQLYRLELSTKAYKLIDARDQVETCRRLWMRLDYPEKATASTATARFHSVKGYVHHWFGKCSDAYKETSQALTELYELCLLGVSVEGEQIVTILRYAAEVCWSQQERAAAVVLVTYAVRYAKSLSAAAYADALECLCYIGYGGEKLIKIAEFVLSTRVEASADELNINVAIAHYYLAQDLYWYKLAALGQLEKAQLVINEVDAYNIWAAVCNSLKGEIIGDEGNLEEATQRFEVALGIAKRILGRNNKTVAEIYSKLTSNFKKMGRFEEADSMFKKAIEAAENSLGPNCSLVAWFTENLANMYMDELNRYKEAKKFYLKSVKIYKSVFGPGYWWLSTLYKRLADIYTKRGQAEKAATYSLLESEVKSGQLEDKFKSTRNAVNKLVNEVLRSLESGSQVIEAPGELVDVLRNFFKAAPKSQPLLARLGHTY